MLKFTLAPLLMLAASLAARRWGPVIGGWIVAIPLTVGPLILLLALTRGPRFAAAVAAGALAGGIAQAAFAVAYAWAGRRCGWPGSVAAGVAAFAAAAAAVRELTLPPGWLFVAVIAALLTALRLLPRPAPGSGPERIRPPRWDIPARMLAAGAAVAALAGLVRLLGPRLAGLLATLPAYTAELAAFTQRFQGAAAAVAVLRGLLLGLFAFAGFFVTLAIALPRAGVAAAFTAAGGAGLVIQAAAAPMLRRHAAGGVRA